MFAHMHACMYMYVCMFVCMYAYMYVCSYLVENNDCEETMHPTYSFFHFCPQHMHICTHVKKKQHNTHVTNQHTAILIIIEGSGTVFNGF